MQVPKYMDRKLPVRYVDIVTPEIVTQDGGRLVIEVIIIVIVIVKDSICTESIFKITKVVLIVIFIPIGLLFFFIIIISMLIAGKTYVLFVLMCNKVFTFAVYPVLWVPSIIFKKGDICDPNNYRYWYWLCYE